MKYETIVCPFCMNGHAHITYEENRVYQLNCPDCHNAIFHRDTSWDNAVNFFKRMVVTDEAALRAQQEQESNDPLTMDELRGMATQWVWVVVNYEHDGEQFKTGRLLRLSSAERDGRLVVLPCKVGAHVHGRYENWSGEVMEFSINSDGVHLYVRSGGGGFYCKPEDIEVEAALKGGDG